MGLSKERKIFIGILSIAGAALVIDQGFLAPSSASAMGDALAAPVAAQGEAPVVNQATASSGLTAAKLLMDRLAKREQSAQSPQATLGSGFTLEQLIEPVLNGTDSTLETQDLIQNEPTLPRIQPSAPDLPTLTAVMPAPSGGGAVLGGKLIRVGQVDSNGFTLLKVRERGVVLRRNGQIYSVEMPTQTGP
ncbi:MAG: hypothetical protein ACF8K1_02250 [Phycisphaerales bacterium JB047]